MAVDYIYEELYDTKYLTIDNNNFYSSNFESLTLKNLSLNYEDRGQSIIENFNYQIKRGQKILIVGETGSGKKTIVDTIIGIKTGFKGEIFVNETNEVKNIFPYVSYVPQNVFLFDDTISNNITFNDENFDQDKLNKVLKVSILDNFINELPKLRYNYW